MWTAHNLLLRGGELGRVDKRSFDPAPGITLADVDWISPCEYVGFFEVVVVDVMPINQGCSSDSYSCSFVDTATIAGGLQWPARRVQPVRVGGVPSVVGDSSCGMPLTYVGHSFMG